MQVMTDEQWLLLEQRLEQLRPWAFQPIRWLRRTIEAIVWRLESA